MISNTYYVSKGAYSNLSHAFSSKEDAESYAEGISRTQGSEAFVFVPVTRFVPGVRPVTKECLCD